MTTDFLEWLCKQVQAQGKSVLVLIWENASWHVSKQVKTWLRQHHQTVLQEARTSKQGVRIIPCWLPIKSPWLNRTRSEVGPRQTSDCRTCSALDGSGTQAAGR